MGLCYCMQAFSSCGTTTTRTGGYRSWRYAGFSLQRLLLLQSTGSRYVSFSSFSSWAQQLWDRGVLRSIWDCPRPGIESGSPALQGGFLTIGPPGSPLGGNFSQDFSLLLGQSSAFLLLVSSSTPLSLQRGLNSAFFTKCPYIPAEKLNTAKHWCLFPSSVTVTQAMCPILDFIL